jgi:uncharacterized protein with GYD domain
MFAIQTAGDFDVDVYHAGELHGPRAQEAMAKFVMTLASFGNIRTTVMKAWDESQHLPLIQDP